MKKLLFFFLLIPFVVSAQWKAAGNVMQVTADGFKYRIPTGTVAPGFFYAYTKYQVDSAISASTGGNGAILNQSAIAQPAAFWILNNGEVDGTFTVGKKLFNLNGYGTGSYFAPTATGGTYGNLDLYTNFNPGANTTSLVYGVNSTFVTGSGSNTYSSPLTNFNSYYINQAASVVTSVNHYVVQSPFFHNTGSIGTDYGVHIYPQAVYGVTTGYAVYAPGVSDISLFGGNVGIGGNSPPTKLFQVVQGTIAPGVAAVTSGSPTVTGTGTQFLSTFQQGQTITIGGQTRTISTVNSNTSITATANWTITSTLPAPVQTSPSVTIGAGGTFTPGTYYYEETAVNGSGETVVSNEVSAVVGTSTSVVTLNWNPVPGFTSINVYRGTTSGGENVYFSTTNYQTYIDNGAAGTSGTPPGSNTATGPTTYTLTGGNVLVANGNGIVSISGPLSAATFSPGVYTYATLPTPISGQYPIAVITDSNTVTWGAAAAGGGANKVMVWWNGSAWDIYAK